MNGIEIPSLLPPIGDDNRLQYLLGERVALGDLTDADLDKIRLIVKEEVKAEIAGVRQELKAEIAGVKTGTESGNRRSQTGTEGGDCWL